MHLKFLKECLPDLSYDLEILKRGTERQNILLYQHTSEFFYDEQRIGNDSLDQPIYDSLFERVLGTDPDLFLTPEYSIPFSQIALLLENEKYRPGEGKLWAICGESISLEQLLQLDGYQNEKILVFHEQIPKTAKGNFLDPMYYLFNVQDSGISKLLVLVQFKTKHMGVWGHDTSIERNNLIKGNDIYILANLNETSSLFTLICSEATEFRDELNDDLAKYLDWHDKPFLILNPQFNPKPNHEAFRDFRKKVFESEKKEVIAVNWSSRSTLKGKPFLSNNTSRSGFYISSGDIDFDSQKRISNNHDRGLYYFSNKLGKHTFLLNSSMELVLIANLPVDIIHHQRELARRDGPEVLQIFSLSEKKSFESATLPIDDKFLEYAKSVNCQNSFLINPKGRVMEKEIISCLCCGQLDSRQKKWFKFDILESVVMNADSEVNRRLTICEDTEADSIKSRADYFDAIGTLDHILSQEKLLPDSIADLRGKKLMIGFDTDAVKEYYRYNILDEQGQPLLATAAYLGVVSAETAQAKLLRYQELFDYNNKGRVVMYYKNGNEYKVEFDSTAARILNTGEDEHNEISREE